MGRALGVSETQLRELHDYEKSAAFTPMERAVLDLAVLMAGAPVDIPEELGKRLRDHLDETQLVELASAIAWENYRARFNRVFGVVPGGFSGHGEYCVLPERGVG